MREGSEEFNEVPLSSLVQKERKITYGIVQPGQFVDDGVILVRGRDYSAGWRDIDEFKRVTTEIDAPYKRSKLRAGDLVITIVGANTGTVAVVPDWLEDANITQTTARVAIEPQKAEPGFVEQVLRSALGQREVYRYQKGGAQPGLNLSDLEKFSIPLPPLPEQRKIALILRTWDNAIEKEKKLLDAKRRRAKGFAQKLLPAVHDEHWPRVSFGSVFSRKTQVCGDDHGLESLSVTKDGIVRQSEYFNKSVTSEDTSKYLCLSKGDFVMSGLNFWMGAADILTDLEIGIVSPAYKVFRINSDVASTSYMKHFVRSHTMLHILRGASIQGASIVRRNLDMENLLSSKFSLPPIKAQEKIANALDLASCEIELCSKRVEALKDQKRGLVQKLLTGAWRVRLSDAEEAAA